MKPIKDKKMGGKKPGYYDTKYARGIFRKDETA